MKRKRKLLTAIIALSALVLAVQLFRMQYGLANYGQEFGTYGQYNWVVRLISEKEGYKILNQGLSRELDWKNLDHVNRFYVIVQDPQGKEFTIEFVHGSEEMNGGNEANLKQIIERKISEQGTPDNADKPRV